MSSSPDPQATVVPGSKVGLPAWFTALSLAFTTGIGATAAFYEKVRVPSLQDGIALRDKRLEVTELDVGRLEAELSKLRTAHDQCLSYNASWVAGASQSQAASQRLQTCTAALQTSQVAMQEMQTSCSLSKRLEVLRADKNAVDVSLSYVQLGHNNWNNQNREFVQERIAELRRQSDDLQAQSLALLRCGK